jgi:hypothetical protein
MRHSQAHSLGKIDNMNNTGKVSLFNSTLKGKIAGLEETIAAITAEIPVYS